MSAQSQKIAVTRAFNVQILNLLQDMVQVFPSDVDILTTQRLAKKVVDANPMMLIQVWRNMVSVPYGEQIRLGNVDFFLQKDYSSDIAAAAASAEKPPATQDMSEYTSMVERIRTSICHMGEENQRRAMKYIQTLTQLSDMTPAAA